ncbi:related to G-patch domain protein [Phialocephala subalpina]|uniref:Related to G-patch domain protein n=1 Tax=Phialocephala subalpina TaxID=576137 RepID=A0A1L7XEC6_9HELO|nr:related to G-patch domain protein [Phialocephala subalpina]
MSDDEYEIPLQDQRVFGAGIKRKRVKFVPSTESSSTLVPPPKAPSKSVNDLYLRLVLPGDECSRSEISAASNDASAILVSTGRKHEEPAENAQVCEICNLPISTENAGIISDGPSTEARMSKQRPHEASLAHQVCLTHSHPPSNLDRNRKGLAYLSAYGWDPDSRRGLGSEGQGIQFPIKTKPKDDKLGIGVVLPKEADRRKKEKPEKLDAGKVRKLHEKDKKKAERLREMFYRNDDVERYLGGE